MAGSNEVEPNRLSVLGQEIRTEVAAAEADFQSAVWHAIEAGERLIEAKKLAGHGGWLPWVEANLPFTDRTARNYMRLARNRNQISDLPTVNDAIAALTPPKRELPRPEPEPEPEKSKAEVLDGLLELWEPIPDDLPDFAKDLVTPDNVRCAVIISRAMESVTPEGKAFLENISDLSVHSQERLLVRLLVSGWSEEMTVWIRSELAKMAELAAEDDELAELEAEIEPYVKAQRSLVENLMWIRNSEAYLKTHATFEEYCLERWDLEPDDPIMEMVAEAER